MSTYREIIGKKIKKVSSDPSDGVDGEMWYNSTTGTLRGIAISEAWISSASMATPRSTMAGGGSNTSAITTGENGGNPSNAVLAESYNGTGWTSETNVPSPLGYTNGTGANSEAYVQLGGGYPSRTGTALDYDGSSWTSATAVPGGSPGYIEAGACGPSADALYCGGNNGETTTWERGSGSWTSGGAMASGAYAPTIVGTQTAAISMGGLTYPGGYRDFNQEYNGSAWTSLTVLPATRGYSGGAGIQTLSMIIGGNSPGPAAVTTTLQWDGSSWTSTPSLGTARNTFCPMGKTIGTAVAGPGNQAPAGTEEYSVSTNVITAAAWASGSNYPTTATAVSGVGSSTAGLFFGGEGPPGSEIATTATYDGSSWTAASSKTTPSQISMNFGTQTSAVAAGGETGPSPTSNVVEEWGGSSWTTAPNTIADTRRNGGGSGASETSGVIFGGGEHPSYSTSCEEYDGTSWSEGGDLPNGRAGTSAGDSATAALYFGGSKNPSPPYTSDVSQSYNGTAWTNTASMLTEKRIGPNGPSTGANSGGGAFLAGGLGAPGTPASTSVESWNGSAWYTAPSLASGVYNQGGNGSTSGAVIAGGSDPSNTNATQELTAETTAVNIETFTTS